MRKTRIFWFVGLVAFSFVLGLNSNALAGDESLDDGSGGTRDGYCGQCVNYPPPVVKIMCTNSGTNICIQTPCTNGFC